MLVQKTHFITSLIYYRWPHFSKFFLFFFNFRNFKWPCGRPNCVLHAHVVVELSVLAIMSYNDHVYYLTGTAPTVCDFYVLFFNLLHRQIPSDSQDWKSKIIWKGWETILSNGLYTITLCLRETNLCLNNNYIN